jgi:hypothetical protein
VAIIARIFLVRPIIYFSRLFRTLIENWWLQSFRNGFDQDQYLFSNRRIRRLLSREGPFNVLEFGEQIPRPSVFFNVDGLSTGGVWTALIEEESREGNSAFAILRGTSNSLICSLCLISFAGVYLTAHSRPKLMVAARYLASDHIPYRNMPLSSQPRMGGDMICWIYKIRLSQSAISPSYLVLCAI